MKRLIIYDLDGTLVDTRLDIIQSVHHMLREMGEPPMADDVIQSYVGRGLTELIKRCLRTDDDARAADGVRRYRAYYAHHYADHSRLLPGTREVLERFKDRRQAVVTNKASPFSEQLLERLGVASYFAEIITGDGRYPNKPDATSTLAVIERAGVAKDDTLLIGDSEVDIHTGRNAGVFTVAVAHGFASRAQLQGLKPDLLVEGFQEFIAACAQYGWQ